MPTQRRLAANKGPFGVADGDGGMSGDADDDLAAWYRQQIIADVQAEAARRLAEVVDPREEARLKRASIVALVDCSTFGGDADAVHGDLVPALMARLGEVRAALSGHGGGLVVIDAQIDEDVARSESEAEVSERAGVESEAQTAGAGARVSLLLSLDGACISCGAAPGTLSGIRDDLLADGEVMDVAFSASLLEHYDDLAREFLERASGVQFR